MVTQNGHLFQGSTGFCFLVSNFCGRINFNQILTWGNTLLGDGGMEKLLVVMCCMNRDFIVFMRKYYPEIVHEQFEFGILKAENNNEEDEWSFFLILQSNLSLP